MPNFRNVQLEEPISLDGQTYTQLIFLHKTRMRDLAAMNGRTDPLEKQVAFMASMAGVPFDVMFETTETDMAQAAQAVADLMGERTAPSAK